MRQIAGVSLLIAILVALLTAPAPARAEERIEGRVLRTTITLCEVKPRGCAGIIVLETNRQGKHEQVTVQVRLGVPIRHEDEFLYLSALDGSVVSVTYVTEKGAIIARSIEMTTRSMR